MSEKKTMRMKVERHKEVFGFFVFLFFLVLEMKKLVTIEERASSVHRKTSTKAETARS